MQTTITTLLVKFTWSESLYNIKQDIGRQGRRLFINQEQLVRWHEQLIVVDTKTGFLGPAQNRKCMTYCIAVRGGPSHGQR